jgi:hypothetical protein
MAAKERGKKMKKGGVASLKPSTFYTALKGCLRGALPLFLKIFPLPFTNPQGKGDRGIGYPLPHPKLTSRAG